ncbi:MAG: glutamine--fructose-6-phosphate transaminase (isomerizing) [Candidatus Babeliales bacterium]
MCSVVGYVGKGAGDAFIFEALSRLEYRGYDSVGFCFFDPSNERLIWRKQKGEVHRLSRPEAEKGLHCGIGHTRWATHGEANDRNAHPHFDCTQSIALVHNGIIENSSYHKQRLEQSGHFFTSETDTEVVAHMLEVQLHEEQPIISAVSSVLMQLEGSYACLCMVRFFPTMLIAFRDRSPLCIGRGGNQCFVASDPLAFSEDVEELFFLPDKSFALVTIDTVELFSFQGVPVSFVWKTHRVQWTAHYKKEYDHYMLKEIYEQPSVLMNTFHSIKQQVPLVLKKLDLGNAQLARMKAIHIIGCGSSFYAASLAYFYMEQCAGIPTYVHLASEFRYANFLGHDATVLYLLISQSGETADTLEVAHMIHRWGGTTIALTNVPSSTLVRESKGSFVTQSGYEVSVASTKAFTSQLLTLYWFAQYLAYRRGKITIEDLAGVEKQLGEAVSYLLHSLHKYEGAIKQDCSVRYARYDHMMILGRHSSYILAQEAALKLKEVGYIWAQSYPAGELKHGPLALVDHSMMTFMFSHDDPLIYTKLCGNAHEVKARQGYLVVYAFEDQQELIRCADEAFVFPRCAPLLGPLVMSGVMQLLTYYVALARGCSIDRPRNLAKTVTVE